MTESTLDSLLKHLHHVESRRAAKNGNGRLPRLCDIEQIDEFFIEITVFFSRVMSILVDCRSAIPSDQLPEASYDRSSAVLVQESEYRIWQNKEDYS